MTWQQKLDNSICTIEDLKKHMTLTTEQEKWFSHIINIHPMRINRYYLSLIDKADKNDPIMRMIVPSEDELKIAGSYDTSGEHENTKEEGLEHKYDQTALMLATNECAAYCRFCFRKRMVGLENKEVMNRFSDAIRYIKKHKEINNILISGGDPFTLETPVLEKFLKKLSRIKHLDFIRFGSRIPVTFPDRILDDPSLLDMLRKYSTKERRIYVVTHFNHPQELTKKSKDAVDMLIRAHVVVNNQTVLMNGVNDNPDTLAELMNKMVRIGINPYYLFQCRPVKRVKAHFQVPIVKGVKIVEDAKKQLNGHSKRFKFVMSHRLGKIEIIGTMGKYIYFKQHQAKDHRLIGKFFRRRANKTGTWLDDFKR